MENALKALNFKVTVAPNVASFASFGDFVLKPFAAQIKPGDFVVVYYSGHGFAFAGDTYLVPINAPKQVQSRDIESVYIPEGSIRAFLADRDPGMMLLFLDSCRKPPVMISDPGGRVAKGFDLPRSVSIDSIVSFATDAGFSAYVADGEASYYTGALAADLLANRHTSYDELRRDIIYDVQEKSGGSQKPYFSDSAATEIHFEPTAGQLAADLEIWTSVLTEGTPAAVKKYLAKHGIGLYAASARQWLKDYEAGALRPRLTLSQISPLTPEADWNGTGEVAFSRLPSGLAVSRILDLNTGAIGNPLDSARHQAGAADHADDRMALNAFVFGTVPARTGSGNGKATRLSKTDTLTLLSSDDSRIFARVNTGAAVKDVVIPIRETEPLKVGKLIATTTLVSSPDSRSLIDGAQLTRYLESFKSFNIRWISISTPAAASESERNALSLQALDAKYQLRKGGFPEGKISIVEGIADGPPGVRLRLFGDGP
jgi:hypothetical protein